MLNLKNALKTVFKKQYSKGAGFALVELLVIISIIGLLASAAMIAMGPPRQITRDIRRRGDFQALYNALEFYWLDNRSYPYWGGGCIENPEEASGNPFIEGKGMIPNYMARAPKDPLFGKGFCYYYKTSGDSQNYHLIARLEKDQEKAKNDGGVFPSPGYEVLYYEVFAKREELAEDVKAVDGEIKNAMGY